VHDVGEAHSLRGVLRGRALGKKRNDLKTEQSKIAILEFRMSLSVKCGQSYSTKNALNAPIYYVEQNYVCFSSV
jgi:hypothetical protein